MSIRRWAAGSDLTRPLEGGVLDVGAFNRDHVTLHAVETHFDDTRTAMHYRECNAWYTYTSALTALIESPNACVLSEIAAGTAQSC
jgi:hypothetical protein